eukprot:11380914-Karenia_brevis.AAC.1
MVMIVIVMENAITLGSLGHIKFVKGQVMVQALAHFARNDTKINPKHGTTRPQGIWVRTDVHTWAMPTALLD